MSGERIIGSLPSKSAEERSRTRANAERLLGGGTEAQKADARRLIDALDQLEAVETSDLRARLSAMPAAQRVVEAFRAAPLSEHERKLIRVLLDNPGSTTTELTQAAGMGDNMVWQMHFGKLCKDRQSYLWPAERAEHRDGLFFSGILAEIDTSPNRFTLKPDVVAALAELGMRPRARP